MALAFSYKNLGDILPPPPQRSNQSARVPTSTVRSATQSVGNQQMSAQATAAMQAAAAAQITARRRAVNDALIRAVTTQYASIFQGTFGERIVAYNTRYENGSPAGFRGSINAALPSVLCYAPSVNAIRRRFTENGNVPINPVTGQELTAITDFAFSQAVQWWNTIANLDSHFGNQAPCLTAMNNLNNELTARGISGFRR